MLNVQLNIENCALIIPWKHEESTPSLTLPHIMGEGWVGDRRTVMNIAGLANPICEPFFDHPASFYFVTCCRGMDQTVQLLRA